MTDGNVYPNRGDGEPSSSLLFNARTGDPRAWDRLVSLTTPLVHRWCRRGGVAAADIADVGQEVYRAVARKLGSFRRDRPGDSFRAWLRTITHRKVLDYWRDKAEEVAEAAGGSDNRARLQEFPEEASGDDPPTQAEEKRLLYCRAVELIRTEFEEKTWQAFWRVEIDGQAPADVAAALGTTLNVVYLSKSRVRKRLREEFAELLED